MRTNRVALILLCLLAGLINAQEPMILPTTGNVVGFVQSDEKGKWIVLSSELLPVKAVVLNQETACVFEGPPGRYAVLQILEEGQPVVEILNLSGPTPPPKPDPQPDPKPDPKPDPDPPQPIEEKYGLISLSRDQALRINAVYRNRAREVGQNFESVSSQISAGGFATIDDANMQLVTKNRSTLGITGAYADNWRSWFEEINKHCQNLSQQGKMVSMTQHAEAYMEIAQGLYLVDQAVTLLISPNQQSKVVFSKPHTEKILKLFH